MTRPPLGCPSDDPASPRYVNRIMSGTRLHDPDCDEHACEARFDVDDVRCLVSAGPPAARWVTEAGELVTGFRCDDDGDPTVPGAADLLSVAVATCLMAVIGRLAVRHAVSTRAIRVRVTVASCRRTGRVTRVRAELRLPADSFGDEGLRNRFRRAAAACPLLRGLHPEIETGVELRAADGG